MGQSRRGAPSGLTHGDIASEPELLGVLSQDPFDHHALSLAEQSAGVGVWSIDLTAGRVRATPQFFHILGLAPTRESVPIELIRELRHPDDRERVLAGFQHALDDGSDAYEIEYRIIRPDGNVRWIFGRGRVVRDAAGKPVRYSGIDLDITDRKVAEAALAAATRQLEELNRTLEQRVRERTAELETEAGRRMAAESRLHQAQKMEAIGQLTSGIAHDFNNILQVIVGNLEIAALTLQRESADTARARSDDRLRNAVELALKASRNAGQLVHRLLAFSREQPLQPAALDVNALIDEMVEMMKRLLGEAIDVRTVLEPALPSVFADRNQLESVLLNLVLNARDAMPRGGRLSIETSAVELSGEQCAEMTPGMYASIRVCDTGEGIPKEILDRVFEPFFSTKASGKGTGLGLAMVYSFATQSRGRVQVQSEVGSGTSFTILLPCMPPSATDAQYKQG